MCSEDGSVTEIEFILPLGPRPKLQIIAGGGLKGNPILLRSKGEVSTLPDAHYRSVEGTKEYVECSNHGLCDYESGACKCFVGYNSSDGKGGRGNRGDCGFQQSFVTPYIYNDTLYYTSCPYFDKKICSGRGQCNEETGNCLCNSGFGKFLLMYYGTCH